MVVMVFRLSVIRGDFQFDSSGVSLIRESTYRIRRLLYFHRVFVHDFKGLYFLCIETSKIKNKTIKATS